MKKLLLLLLFCLPVQATAESASHGLDRYNVTKWTLSNFKLLELKSVYLDYMHYTYAVEPFITPMAPTNRLDLNVNIELLNRILFMDNIVHSETDKNQYALIGWNYRVGVRLGNYVDLYFAHESLHLLDRTLPVGPSSYDALGMRIYFYRRRDQ